MESDNLVEYKLYGEGYPILLLHGGHSSANETLFLRELDLTQFQVIIPSRPGYGKTPITEGRSPESAARSIEKLMTELGIRKYSVAGVSAGGLTALAMASLFADNVDKLILMSAVTKRWLMPADSLYKISAVMFRPGVEVVTWSLFRFMFRAFPKLMSKVFTAQLSVNPVRPLKSAQIEILQSLINVQRSRRGFINDIDQELNKDLLRTIVSPTLIIHSKFDLAVEFSHAIHARNCIENSRLILLENNWGHLVWLNDDFDVLAKQLMSFIRDDQIHPDM